MSSKSGDTEVPVSGRWPAAPRSSMFATGGEYAATGWSCRAAPARRRGVRLLAALVTLAGACDDGPPPLTASGLVITPASVGGRHRPRVVTATGSLFVSGASNGLSFGRVVSPGLLDLQIPVTNGGWFTSGTLVANLQLTVSLPAHHPVEVWVVDGAGRESPHLHGAFDVVVDTSCSSWTTAKTTGPVFEDLVWTGARFVGVGAAGISVSDDAFDWTATAVTTPLTAAASSGAGLVALGDDAVLTSPDGLDWTAHPPAGTGVHVEAVTWTGQRFVAVGHTGAVLYPHPAILTSPDGITWSEQAVPVPRSAQPGEYRALTGLAWSGNLLVATSNPGNPAPLAVFVSPDGIAWEAVEIPTTAGLPRFLFDIAYGDGGFAAVGPFGVLFTSSDGQTWMKHDEPDIRGFVYEAVSTGPTLVAGGWQIITCDAGAQCTAWDPPSSASVVRALLWSGLECVAARDDGTILVSP